MTEIWKDIPEYEGLYEVSDKGSVRSLTRLMTKRTRWGGFVTYLKKGQPIKPHDLNGYVSVTISKDGKMKSYFVHQLVAMAFVSNKPSDEYEINHLDGDRSNNTPENLVWVTRSENMEHRTLVLGGACGGEAASLVEELVGEVEGGEILVAGVPQAEGGADGPTAGFKERGGGIREVARDERAFRSPQAEVVRGAGVVDDGDGIVEIVADGSGGYFLRCHVAMNMPLALSSCGRSASSACGEPRVVSGSGANSGCAALKAAVTAVVSLRVRVQTE